MRYLQVSAGLVLALVCACSSSQRSGCCDVVKHNDTSETRRGGDAIVLTSIADSLAPLRDRFNMEKGKPRLVALLSPT
jgi:hypothetical protein